MSKQNSLALPMPKSSNLLQRIKATLGNAADWYLAQMERHGRLIIESKLTPF